MNFTFGILTKYDDEEKLKEVIDSIHNLNIPENGGDYQVLVIGEKKVEGSKYERYIYFDESAKPAWITRKKNLLARAANFQNIVLMHGFKEYCAIAFFKGALLQDADGVLVQQTENVQSGRQIRFSNVQEINKMKSLMKAYIFEAIAIENIGVKVESKKVEELIWPAELLKYFAKDKAFQQAFAALSPGRQRGYHLFFTSAKQSKTITTRIESSISRILIGKGLTDCICGLSKRMPNCDGSHKLIAGFKK